MAARKHSDVVKSRLGEVSSSSDMNNWMRTFQQENEDEALKVVRDMSKWDHLNNYTASCTYSFLSVMPLLLISSACYCYARARESVVFVLKALFLLKCRKSFPGNNKAS